MCNKMSDVRFSNASPTLERVDARQPDTFRPSVRRNLFGTPDPREIKECAEEAMREDARSFRQKYNFDPVADQPLPGDFRWVTDDSAPEFYLRPAHGSQREVPRASGRDDAERRSAAEERSGSRKRRSQDSGSCSNGCPSKNLHTDGDDEDDRSDGAGGQAARAAERRPSRPENSAEVR